MNTAGPCSKGQVVLQLRGKQSCNSRTTKDPSRSPKTARPPQRHPSLDFTNTVRHSFLSALRPASPDDGSQRSDVAYAKFLSISACLVARTTKQGLPSSTSSGHGPQKMWPAIQLDNESLPKVRGPQELCVIQ